jgi:hypothetical protein
VGPTQVVSPENSPTSVLQRPDSAPHSPQSTPSALPRNCTTPLRTHIRSRRLSRRPIRPPCLRLRCAAPSCRRDGCRGDAMLLAHRFVTGPSASELMSPSAMVETPRTLRGSTRFTPDGSPAEPSAHKVKTSIKKLNLALLDEKRSKVDNLMATTGMLSPTKRAAELRSSNTLPKVGAPKSLSAPQSIHHIRPNEAKQRLGKHRLCS